MRDTTWCLARRNAVAVVGFAALAGLAAMTGCGPEPGGPTVLQARGQPYVADVPVPAKFELARQRSEHSASSAGQRTVRHYYEGRESPIAVRNFYIQNMPQFRWELQDETLGDSGVYTLRYVKGGETCEIRIENMPAAIMGKITQIRALIQPSGASLPG